PAMCHTTCVCPDFPSTDLFTLIYYYCLLRLIPPLPVPPLFPYTTLFRSVAGATVSWREQHAGQPADSAADLGSLQVGYLPITDRSEEHTSELQSRFDLVCRLLLEKKN